MIATLVNCALVILGSLLGILLRHRISERLTTTIVQGLSLCVMTIGLASAMKTQNMLCMIVCMVGGVLMGEGARIEDRLDSLGSFLQRKLIKSDGEGSRFTEGFVTASVLFCVGAMAVNGAIAAGTVGDYSILITKGVIDGVTAISFAAAMGIGVAFSSVPILLYQGGLTLLASILARYLSPALILEMSAVGGVIIMGIGLNMLGLSQKRIKVGNMLPAIFLPIAYLPLSAFLLKTFSFFS